MDFDTFVKRVPILSMQFIQWDREMEGDHHFGGGVYRMYDDLGEIVYVGKSNDIHRRLLQHIGKRTNSAYFIEQVKRIEYFVINSPVFQTMLEGILIAFHRPKFNDEVQDEAEMMKGQ